MGVGCKMTCCVALGGGGGVVCGERGVGCVGGWMCESWVWGTYTIQ